MALQPQFYQNLQLTHRHISFEIETTALRSLLECVRFISRLRSVGSATIAICLVATGQVDAMYVYGPHIWDFAASHLIAMEAGAVVSSPTGIHILQHVSYRYSYLTACPLQVFMSYSMSSTGIHILQYVFYRYSYLTACLLHVFISYSMSSTGIHVLQHVFYR